MTEERSKLARKDLGHSSSMMIKLHPDLKEYVQRKADENYCSAAEYLRKLIVDDMRREG